MKLRGSLGVTSSLFHLMLSSFLKVNVNFNQGHGSTPSQSLVGLVCTHLAGDHEQGEEQDEGALGDGDPVCLLQGE